MSEKIYACLLRFYPSHFRQVYGAAIMQLFRDRIREEEGFFSRTRLWLELLADLAISVPRLHLAGKQSLAAISSQAQLAGLPAFFTLEEEKLPLRRLLMGGILSCAFLSLLFSVTLIQIERKMQDASQSSRFMQYKTTRPSQAIARSDRPPAFDPPAAPSVTHLPFGASQPDLSPAQRRRVLANTIAKINEFYVYPVVAQQMTAALTAHQKSGDYYGINDAATFAAVLTSQLRDISHDQHLFVAFDPNADPSSSANGPTAAELAEYKNAMQRTNCTFENVKILRHNVGYLRFSEFPDPAICGPTLISAMKTLNHADSLIFDLRDNHGGDPKMVSLIASYLFPQPTHLNDIYDRPQDQTEHFWTKSPVAGNLLANKPAYVLTSHSTFSGAEEFTYDLKMLQRAIIVGETTAGGAHLARTHPLDDHFSIRLPEARPINPISKKDWEGTGIKPNVQVDATLALDAALRLANAKKKNN